MQPKNTILSSQLIAQQTKSQKAEFKVLSEKSKC